MTAAEAEERRAAPLIEPPRLRTGEERSATRLELFFDLAYVLAVAELASAAYQDPTLRGSVVFVGLFTAVWWSWVSTILYANRYDTNDVIYRLAKLAGTFAACGLAASASGALGEEAVPFVLSFVGLRVLLFLLYLRAYRHVPEARANIAFYLAAIAASGVVWTVSLAFEGNARYLLWAVGLAVAIAAPFLATRFSTDVPLHLEHLPERFGLFVILVLGESLAAVVTGLQETHWDLDSLVVGALGFSIAAALWWSHFDLGGAAAKARLLAIGGERASHAHDTYVFAHLPITLGLAAVGVGIEHFVVHPVGELSAGAEWMLYGGVATYLVGTVLLLAGTSGSLRAAWPWPGVAVPAVLIFGALTVIPPKLSVAAITATVVATVVVGMRQQRRGELETTEA
ncbi:MAG: low temperature requirement protein A [Actinomycetota bacterium]|nr:low temperature requirement protein A [Actinomycetota bacterium]